MNTNSMLCTGQPPQRIQSRPGLANCMPMLLLLFIKSFCTFRILEYTLIYLEVLVGVNDPTPFRPGRVNHEKKFKGYYIYFTITV